MKIISYSLWGNNPKYTIGAIKNANLARHLYPDWVCRFYCAVDVPADIIKELKKISQVIETKEEPNWKFATKRFLPISEEGIERIIFRDTDSRLSERELAAVEDWTNKGTILHVMKDHPYHGLFPILAGMWGILGDYITNIEQILENYVNNKNFYHYDQVFLQKYIWPLFSNNVTIHDEFFAKKNFPIVRNNLEFVGEVFDENDNNVEEHSQILRRYLYENR